MEALNIHSQLPHFRLITRILKTSPEGIRGTSDFNRTPLYAGLEAMAQLAALHVRQRLQFERHAFLLKVRHCRMPVIEHLDGCFEIKADLCSQSSHAFHYDTVALGPHGVEFKSDLLIGTRDCDEYFSKDILKPHYQRIWAQLRAC